MSKPRIRVKGFDEEWDTFELGEIADVVNDTNSDNTISEVFTNSASLGIISQRDYFNHDIAKQDKIHGYSVVSPNDFVYNPRVSVTAPVGPISKNRLGRSGAMSPLYTIFRTHDINDVFLEHYFKTHYWHRYMRFNGNTGARFDRFAISLNNFFKMGIPVPDKKEQKSIAETFELLDNEILASQDKINSLKSLKICHLNRLFPIGGGKTPPMRIEGFIADWKEAELGDCFDERQERSSEGELLSVTIGNGIMRFSELNRHDNSSADKSNYKVVCKGDIVYNSMRMWQGASGCSEYDGIVSPAYTVLIPREGINSKFFACFFKNPEMINMFRINSQGMTSDTWNLKYPAFSKIKIRFPKNPEEQLKIAEYFENLNKAIRLHEEELERLKSLKESCLQGMFV